MIRGLPVRVVMARVVMARVVMARVVMARVVMARVVTALVVTALVVTALAACAEGPREVAESTCDPRDPACPVGTLCRVVEMGGLCLAQTPQPADAACDPASCGADEACLVVEGLLGCHPLCDPQAPDPGCPGDRACAYALAGSGLGICPAPCALGQLCGPGGSCATTPNLAYPTCVAAGPVGEGESCALERCAIGLACLTGGDAPRCARLCDPQADACPVGRCTGEIVGVDGVGYCADDS